MGIIGLDASQLAEKAARGPPGRRGVAARTWLANRAFDNKIETIQCVLRHFLRETGGPDLGKS
jgi:hypothetical protein